jgi:hypothetical protein
VKRALLAVSLTGCFGGSAPELSGLSDQIVVVGTELRVDLDGLDPDGDRLTYGFRAPSELKNLDSRASISVAPSGAGVFRWTPIAPDLGDHAFDFTVSDGDTEVVDTITINVVTSLTAPIFRAPLGSGTTFDTSKKPCLDLDVTVDDVDTVDVALSQHDPVIDGATLTRIDGQHARWSWCPEGVLPLVTDRETLVLGADDRDNAETIKNYVIVLK